MKIIRKAGDTSNILQVFIQDSSSTTGAGLTGLLNNSAGLTAYYHKDTDTTATAISLVTMTVGTFTSSGFKEIDATNMPGWYQLCPPDAALSTTGTPKSVGIHLKGATNMAPLAIEIQLIAADLQDTVRLGLTAMPNVASGSAGAIVTSGTGTAQLSVSSGLVTLAGVTHTGAVIPTVTTVTNQLTAAQIATGVWTDTTAGDFTTALSVGKSLMNGVSLGTGLTVNDITTKTGYSLTQAFPTNFSSMAISVGGAVTVGTNSDKTGYSLTQAFPTNFSALSITAGGTVNSDIKAVNADTTSAASLAKTTRAIGRATASGVPTTTSIPTSACTPAGAAADQFKGRIITFDADTTTTALRGQATDITASSNAATPTFTVTALTTAPVSGDTFSIT